MGHVIDACQKVNRWKNSRHAPNNNNKRYQSYSLTASLSGYGNCSKLFDDSYQYIRGLYPSPDGKYEGWKSTKQRQLIKDIAKIELALKKLKGK